MNSVISIIAGIIARTGRAPDFSSLGGIDMGIDIALEGGDKTATHLMDITGAINQTRQDRSFFVKIDIEQWGSCTYDRSGCSDKNNSFSDIVHVTVEGSEYDNEKELLQEAAKAARRAVFRVAQESVRFGSSVFTWSTKCAPIEWVEFTENQHTPWTAFDAELSGMEGE